MLLGFILGFATCALVVLLWHFWQGHRRYMQYALDSFSRQFKRAHPSQHRARTALGEMYPRG